MHSAFFFLLLRLFSCLPLHDACMETTREAERTKTSLHTALRCCVARASVLLVVFSTCSSVRQYTFFLKRASLLQRGRKQKEDATSLSLVLTLTHTYIYIYIRNKSHYEIFSSSLLTRAISLTAKVYNK